ncbi:thioredoxin-like protein [Purpureocillium lavendulum]|uniref:Thioredoxin-like protein n=1 Tax=Purpureocillium lavendulum TaxID=1247861 RepID=A0AB34FYE7_9HYPO|nr:thioredoxin-like protein [Purpureocillium lavendulum]
MMPDETPPAYTLHYFPFSLYSLMSRFAFVLGQALNPETAPRLQVKMVNLHREENYSESYLTHVNHKGQPELLPEEHRETIDRLMNKIYAYHAKALLVAPDDRKDGIQNQAAAMLENPELSETYRRALEIKSVLTLEPDNILRAERQAHDLMSDLASLLEVPKSEGKTWIFGDKPTILDAHAAALTARLLDQKRHDLVLPAVKEYTEVVLKTEEWRGVTHGRPTLWDVSMGHAADLHPL